MYIALKSQNYLKYDSSASHRARRTKFGLEGKLQTAVEHEDTFEQPLLQKSTRRRPNQHRTLPRPTQV